MINFKLLMTLSLYNYYSEENIECIFNWAPKDKQWWITGFNPEFDDPNEEDMVLIGKIDFSGYEELYRGLELSIEAKYTYLRDNILFDTDNYIVWVVW